MKIDTNRFKFYHLSTEERDLLLRAIALISLQELILKKTLRRFKL